MYRLSDQVISLGNAYFRQLYPAVGERLELDGGWEAKNTRDLVRREIFGVDEHTDSEAGAHEVKLLRVFGSAHAGYGMAAAHFFCEHTAEDIQLVSLCYRNQQIRLVNASLLLNVVTRAVAADSVHVERVDKILDHLRVLVYHDHVVILPRQLSGKRSSDLSAAHNDNIHMFPSL